MKKRGRPRAKDKKICNGILWVLRTGVQWNEKPRRFSSYATAWRRLKQWEEDEAWEKIWKMLLQILSQDDKLNLEIGMVDGTFSPAKKKGGGHCWSDEDRQRNKENGCNRGTRNTAYWNNFTCFNV